MGVRGFSNSITVLWQVRLQLDSTPASSQATPAALGTLTSLPRMIIQQQTVNNEAFKAATPKPCLQVQRNVCCNDVRLTRQITLSQPQQRQQQPPIPTLTEKTQRWELTTLNPKPHIFKKKSGVDFSRQNINGNLTRKPTPDSTRAFSEHSVHRDDNEL